MNNDGNNTECECAWHLEFDLRAVALNHTNTYSHTNTLTLFVIPSEYRTSEMDTNTNLMWRKKTETL